MPENNVIEQIWPPLRAEQDGAGITVECFGRTYRMGGMLPESVVSGGREVLAAPACLRASFGGETKPVIPANTYIDEQTDDRVVFLHQGTVGNVILNGRVTVERDGLVWIDLLLLPFTIGGAMPCDPADRAPRLDGLVLELPVRREPAELYHYWPSVDGGLTNSGSIPADGLSLPFRPHLWVGREEAGLSFYAESDQYWQNADPSGVLTLRVTDDAVVLCVRLLDSMPAAWAGRANDDWGSALEPVSFSFGLQATPVKPFRPVGDYRRVCHKGLANADPAHPYELDAFEREADELASVGVRWRTFHEDWSVVQNYGRPQDEALFRAKVDALHKRGMKAMVYFGYEYASCAPGFFDDYRGAVLRSESGSLNGGWQRLPPQRAYIVCYAGSYADTMLARCRRAMEVYGVDGIYTDGTFIPWACANEAHGCGWTDGAGNRHSTWPLRRVRDHVRRLYVQTHELGGIVEAHQSGCVLPMLLAFCDSYWDGEHIALTTDPVTGAFHSLSGRELIEKYTSGTGAGVGVMRAEFTGVNIGVPCQFLSYSPTFDECCGLTVLYGVLPKPSGYIGSVREAARHWRVMDEYGLTNERFIPFWRPDCPVRCTDSRLSCSVWDTPEGLAVVFVNLSGEAAETDFTCERPYREAALLPDGTPLPAAHIAVPDASPVYVLLKK